MIIGSGLVASGFEAYEEDDRYLIFASGVSDSTNTDSNAFIREHKLLEKMINTHYEKIFVYFSTCSVYDSSMQNSPYVLHKLSMEAMIKEQHSDYHIFRISNLVGNTNNPHTVFNFFIQHIISGNFFYLWKHAYRNLIDIDDAVTVCHNIIQQQLFKNEVINIANPVNYPAIQIVEAIEAFTQKKGIYELVDKGSNPVINTYVVQQLFQTLNIHFDDEYLNKMFEKYFISKNSVLTSEIQIGIA